MSNPMHRDTWLKSQDAWPAGNWPLQQASGPDIRNFQPRLGSDPQHLILQGYVVDSVGLIGQIFEGRLSPPEQSPDGTQGELKQAVRRLEQTGIVFNTIREWGRIAQKHFGHIRKGSEKTGEEAYLVTLVKNRIPKSMDRAERIQQMRSAIDVLTRKSFLSKTLTALRLHKWQTRVNNVLMGLNFQFSTKEGEILMASSSLLSLSRVVDQKFGVTEGQCYAVMPAATRKGDKIALFNGAKTPFVLRNKGDFWEMIGECYVHGIMCGEEWDEGRCVDMELR